MGEHKQRFSFISVIIKHLGLVKAGISRKTEMYYGIKRLTILDLSGIFTFITLACLQKKLTFYKTDVWSVMLPGCWSGLCKTRLWRSGVSHWSKLRSRQRLCWTAVESVTHQAWSVSQSSEPWGGATWRSGAKLL